MSFHHQAAPPSSHLPPMDDRDRDRCIPSMSIPPPGPYSHTIADYRALPSSLTLPPISQLNPSLATNFSHRYLIPYTAAPQIGSNVQQAHPLHAPDPASFRGAGCTTSNASSSSRAVTVSRHALIHGVDREVGKVDLDQSWIEGHLADLEVYVRNDPGEEKGKVYLGLWLGIREAGLRDKQGVRYFMAKSLMPYPWFKGDETMHEALRTLHRLEFINAGLLAKKHTENANWYWNKKIGNITVREFWTEEAKNQRQKAQAQAAHVQAQAQAQG
ncbi:hypothetical protein F5888DRAFT_1803380 [Russula emetica]|nr:hypothetical protein F5888DRAFT_1803380 [Russula emetica]